MAEENLEISNRWEKAWARGRVAPRRTYSGPHIGAETAIVRSGTALQLPLDPTMGDGIQRLSHNR